MGSIQFKEALETNTTEQEICAEFKWFINGHKENYKHHYRIIIMSLWGSIYSTELHYQSPVINN